LSMMIVLRSSRRYRLILTCSIVCLSSMIRTVFPYSILQSPASFSPLFGGKVVRTSIPSSSLLTTKLSSSTLNNDDDVAPTSASQLKNALLTAIREFKTIQNIDGQASIDFGVKGGELNRTSRAPQKVDYYAISEGVGLAADKVLAICDSLEDALSIEEPTKFLGDAVNGTSCPLEGPWKLLFTTAADASFSSNSTRGAAKAQNIVNAAKGIITNVIDFATRADGTEPALKQLNVVIRATALSKRRVGLQFRYVRAVLTKFFFLPLFGKRLTIYVPVPGPFVTRIIVFLGRLVRRNGTVKKPPQAYFDVLFLDEDLRVHKTGEDNIFVQVRDSWKDANSLIS